MPDGKPDPIRPIRSLLRGLEALSALRATDGLTVTETAKRARLPRTTAYRILETLRLGGFVERESSDERYRLTERGDALVSSEATALAAARRTRSNGHVDSV